MKFAALMAAIALIPVAFAAGYLVHKDPAAPAFGAYISQELGVKHATGMDTDDWLAVAVTGPNKGGSMDASMALMMFPNHKAIEQSAQGKVKYVEMKCQTYSNGDKKLLYSAPIVIRKCTSVVKTRKQVEKYLVGLLTPEPKS